MHNGQFGGGVDDDDDDDFCCPLFAYTAHSKSILLISAKQLAFITLL